jgi:hypothetical protein
VIGVGVIGDHVILEIVLAEDGDEEEAQISIVVS